MTLPRRLLLGFGALVVLVLMVVVIGVAVIQTAWAKDKLRALAVAQAAKVLNGELSIGRMEGSLFSGVVLEDVSLAQDGSNVIQADRVELKYSLVSLVRTLTFAEIAVRNPHVRVVQTSRGWNVANLTRPSKKPSGKPVDFAIHRLRVTGGSVDVEPLSATPRSLTDVGLDASLAREADGVAMRIASLTGTERTTGYTIAALSGAFRRSFAEMNAAFDLVRETSRATGTLKAGLDGSNRSVSAGIDVTSFDLATVLGTPRWASDITGHAQMQGVFATGASPSLQFSFAGPQAKALGYEGQHLDISGTLAAGLLKFSGTATAYGAAISTDARWRLADATTGDKAGLTAAGTFRHAQLRQLPPQLVMPRFDTSLNGRYRVATDAGGWSADVALDASRFEGAVLQRGTTGHVESRRGQTRYQAQGDVAALDPARLSVPLALPLLSEDRFKGHVNGTFNASGTLGTSAERTLTAAASLFDTELGGARFGAMTVTVGLAGSKLDLQANGDFTRLTPALAGLGESVPFELNGAADVAVTLHDLSAPLAPDRLDVRGVVTLEPSSARGLAVRSGRIDGDLVNGLATIRTLTLDAAGLRLSAQGTAALGDTGTSALHVSAAADDLAVVGSAFGLELAGAADLNADISGPAGEPRAKGTLNARSLAYGTSSALTANATFDATMPDLDLARVNATSALDATFVKAGSVEIVRLAGTAGYAARQLTVETRVEQESRTLELAGLMSLEPERRDITLRRFQIETGGSMWSLPAGEEARIALGKDRANVEGLVLMHDVQRIEVSGTVALSDEPIDADPPLTVRIDRVQLADVNRLLLSTRQLEGMVSATATIEGPIRAPDISAHFVIVNGRLEQMPFNAARGDVRYGAGVTTIDAEVQQTSQNRLTVAGTVATPSALDHPPGIDLRIQSTPVDLALVQGFTTELTQVGGTGTFDLHLSGQTNAPVIDGSVSIDQAHFVLNTTGAKYKDFNARLRFEHNFLAIDGFQLIDDDGHELVASGGLDVIGQQAGGDRALDVRVSAKKFHLLANKSGNLQIDADLSATGGFTAPRISGSVRVSDGRLEVDKILETTTKTVYSTRPQVAEDATPGLPRETRASAEAPAAASGGGSDVPPPDSVPASPEAKAADAARAMPAPPAPEAPAPGVFDRLDLAVTLEMPDNLVLRGRDLRVSGSSIGLGDVNIVTGGSINVEKHPGVPLSIVGNLNIERGYYSFQGRRFEVQRGSSVRFRGQLPVDPSLDVTATREISGIETVVHVQGTMREPTIALASRPPLDDADVLSLIVFGQQINDLGSSQRTSLSERVASMAAGAVAAPISDSVARALNLDLFEIQAPSGSSAPVVSLGSQIGSRLYVGLRQEVGLGDRRVLSLEYRLSDVLRLVTSVAQGVPEPHTDRRTEASGVDLIYQTRY